MPRTFDSDIVDFKEDSPMTRKVKVMPLGRSMEGDHFKDMISYRVSASVDSKTIVFEARLTLDNLEILDKPEDKIREYYAAAPLPKSGQVVDLNL
jgi:hypothetical protein